jgi:S-adenosylmethionine:tRNA ribosyltransferase-isomerase
LPSAPSTRIGEPLSGLPVTTVAAFDYELPPKSIAQVPLARRDDARLLVDGGDGRDPEHRTVRDLSTLVGPGDLLVVNETRVRPARLHLHKQSGGAVEVLLLEPEHEWTWSALVRPARRVQPGVVLFASGAPIMTVGDRGDDIRAVTFVGERAVDDVLGELGEMPLPPYIHERLADPERYQTTYAAAPGSAAAPTAGLHLTTAVLDGVRAAGADVAVVDLRVGLDTFSPLRGTVLDDHVMHSEYYRVPPETAAAVEAADRVIAVGTTTVRALEASAIGPAEGRTDLFIRPGFDWRVVDVLLTNFHVPRSSLLVMLEAFMGAGWRDLYAVALETGYRFLSFGDAMIVARGRAASIGHGR